MFSSQTLNLTYNSQGGLDCRVDVPLVVVLVIEVTGVVPWVEHALASVKPN